MTERSDDEVQFRDVMIDLMAKTRITQQELAKRTCVSQSSIAQYMSGKRSPNVNTMLDILDEFGYEVQIVKRKDD